MLRGTVYIILASLLFGFMPTMNKYIMLQGLDAVCVTFFTQVIVLVLSLLICAARRIRVMIPWQDAVRLMFLGAVGVGGTSYLLARAITIIPAGLGTVLHFMYPTLVSVVMVVVFGQRMTKLKLLAIVSSIAGMSLISGLGEGGGGLRLSGVVFALCSSMTYAFYIIYNDVGSVNKYPQFLKLVWCAAGTVLVFGALAAVMGVLRLAPTPICLVFQLLTGLCSLSAFFLINSGIRIVGASTASFINMLEPVTSVIVSFLVYHDKLTFRTVAGVVLVLCAVFFVAVGDRNKNAGPAPVPEGQR